MNASPGLVLYVLTDTSGSTSRRGFADGWNLSIPRLLGLLERRAGEDARVSLLAYAGTPSIRVALQPVGALLVAPTSVPGGLSGLAAGLRLLTRTVEDDCRQLAADGVAFLPPVALVVTDGLPTDAAADVLAARRELGGAPGGGPPVTVHLAVPADVDELAVAALADRHHTLTTGTAQLVADSVVAIAEAVVSHALRGRSS